MLDQKFIDKMKKRLEKDKKRLEKELAGFTSQNIHNQSDYEAQFPDFGSELDENAREVATFGDRLTLERTLEKELRDVKNTLERIKSVDYGFCHNCHEEIPQARLEARPPASPCIK